MPASPSTTFLYNSARAKFSTAQIDWPIETVKCVLLNGAYAPSVQDNFLSDVPNGAIMATRTMTGLGQTNGICFGVIPEFDAFLSPSQCIAMLLYIDSGDPTTSQLVYYSADGFGFPFIPQGFNYAVSFDQTAGGYFQV